MKTFMRKLLLKYSTLLKRDSNLISSFGIYHSITISHSKLHKSLRVLPLQLSWKFLISFLVQKNNDLPKEFQTFKFPNSFSTLLSGFFFFLKIKFYESEITKSSNKIYHNWRNFMCKSWEQEKENREYF
jgi:hypothetical protein